MALLVCNRYYEETEMILDDSLKNIVNEYREERRNKIFAPMDLLVSSAAEETGESVNASQLNSIIEEYTAGIVGGSGQPVERSDLASVAV